MTAKLFDYRLMLALLTLALLLMFVIVLAQVAPQNEIWFRPGTDLNAPINDCGRNHTLKVLLPGWFGSPCEVTKGTVSDEYAQEVKKQFQDEGNPVTSALEMALDYIEKVIWAANAP